MSDTDDAATPMASLRNKLWVGYGSLLLIVVAVSLLSLAVFARYSHALERVFRENYDSAVYSQTMQRSLEDLDGRAQRLAWGEPAAAKPADVAAVVARFDAALTAQVGNCLTPEETDATRRLQGLWADYRSRYARLDPTAGAAVPYRHDLMPRYQQMRRVAQEIANLNMSAMVSADGQAKQTLVTVRSALVVLVAAGTGLAAAVVWTAGRAVVRPLGELTASAQQIADGRLDLHLPTRSADEVGRLADAFNVMAARLRQFKQTDHDRLLRTQQTTQLAIDSLPDVVIVVGPGGVVEIANAAAKAHFGIEVGRQLAALGLPWLSALYAAVTADGRGVEPDGYASAIQLFVDGHERFLLPRAVPMVSPDGRLLGVTVIGVDVTALRHVDEAKSGLISTVSHELRTPLTSLRLLLDVLLGDADGASPRRRMLEVARGDAGRLHRTIENLLSLSRMESGRAQYQFRPQSPGELLASATDPLRQLFADKRVELSVAAPAGLPPVLADADAVRSALTNLLSNAMKFTPAGGRVRASAAVEGDAVRFAVADGGPGIPPEFRPRIFEKFFRVPSVAGPSGAGLGLSITRSIAEAHHGRVGFECPPDGGAVFRLDLPLADGASSAGRSVGHPAGA